MNNIYLKDVRQVFYPNEEICGWEFLKIKNSDVRIYYKPSEKKGLGFNFYAVEKNGFVCNDHTKKNEWHKEYCMVECVFNGIAFFDGIRHLYYGDDETGNYGYHYYPDLETIADTIIGLRSLEKKYCRDYDG